MPLKQAQSRKSELLRCLPELAGASAKDLAKVSRLFEEVEFDAGAVLMTEGRPGRQVFLIVEGRVEVTLRGSRLAVLGPGEVVGEMALVDGGPRSATVTALEPVTGLVAGCLEFAVFTEQPPGFKALARAMSRRIRAIQP
jgi:CRP-like cAMP-binding protein